MKKSIFSILLLLISITCFCTTITITNSGTTFTPDTITINVGDSVQFTLSSSHNAIEVSEVTWNSNGNTSNSGFSTAFGGGLVLPAQLSVGAHYYVCSKHAAMGMKGVIIVEAPTEIIENKLQANLSIYPNPTPSILNINYSGKELLQSIKLYNLMGKLVYENTKITSFINSISIDFLNAGIYLLETTTAKEKYVQNIYISK